MGKREEEANVGRDMTGSALGGFEWRVMIRSPEAEDGSASTHTAQKRAPLSSDSACGRGTAVSCRGLASEAMAAKDQLLRQSQCIAAAPRGLKERVRERENVWPFSDDMHAV